MDWTFIALLRILLLQEGIGSLDVLVLSCVGGSYHVSNLLCSHEEPYPRMTQIPIVFSSTSSTASLGSMMYLSLVQ